MDIEKARPITWNADDYGPGDRFAVLPGFRQVYEIKERRERGTVIEFKATFASAEDQEEHGDFTFTFPGDFPLSARRRIRTIVIPCMLCGTRGKHELDTAYATVNTGLCANH